jgi:hypothetical protein
VGLELFASPVAGGLEPGEDLLIGVTFTSDSGVFLTAPEPDATMLATASTAALLGLARRRSAR